MIEPAKLDELATRLSQLMPSGLSEAKEDLGKNFRAVIQAWLDRLDLVTREEFEVQKAVLAKTREKLEILEAQLAEQQGDD